MSGNYRNNITRGSIWVRLIAMIIMAIAFNIAEILAGVVTVFQFLASLVSGQSNQQLRRFGVNLAKYIQQIVQFQTFASEERPFPFSPWPDEPFEADPAPAQVVAPAPSTADTDHVENAATATETAKPKAASSPASAKAKPAARKPTKSTGSSAGRTQAKPAKPASGDETTGPK